jgi:hypothetical protein
MLSIITISIMVVGSYSPVQFVREVDCVLEGSCRAQDFLFLAQKPVGGPNAMESPCKVFKLLLP